jgi:hypothetical protein
MPCKKPFVYIASPYTKGDVAINVRSQMALFDELLSDEVVLPYIPLWSHFQHLLFPRPYQDWIAFDLAILPRFDALLRVDAEYSGGLLTYRQSESSGADGEVKAFEALGRPVFYRKDALYDWAEQVFIAKERRILEAVARGWCAPANEQKVMDSDLAIAIAKEVEAELAA